MKLTLPKRWIWLVPVGAIVVLTGFGLEAREAVEIQVLTEGLERTEQLGTLSVGPDVTIIDLDSVSNYTDTTGGEDPSPCPPGYGTGGEDCRGYAIGTNSCNVGSYPVDWCDDPSLPSFCRMETSEWHPFAPAAGDDHSVISQNLYRLKDGRFLQIGASFLKHGFLSLNTGDADCVWNDEGKPNTSCVGPPAGGAQLGTGCTDFYGSGLNGSRPLGRRSDVQIAGADHPTNPAGGDTTDDHDQRIVVAESDLDPAQNPGALYWGEGHYAVRDDARAGNGLNNASHRQMTVGALPQLNLSFTGPTVRELPAIYAWQAVDSAVEIVQADKDTFFTGEEAEAPLPPGTFYPDYTITERFHAARRVTETTEGVLQYHYEYAIYNLNSHTSADGFVIDLGSAANFGGVGFHDVAHHSGEPYDTSDWVITMDEPNGIVRWDAVPAGMSTNALRWGTTFSFWFDSDVGPNPVEHRLQTFRDDGELVVPFTGPLPPEIFSDGFESGDTTAWSTTVP